MHRHVHPDLRKNSSEFATIEQPLEFPDAPARARAIGFEAQMDGNTIESAMDKFEFQCAATYGERWGIAFGEGASAVMDGWIAARDK